MTLSKRQRGAIVVVAVLVPVIGSEVALELYYKGEALVQVENLGAEPVENLTVIHGPERIVVKKVDAGATAKIYLGGRGQKTLRIEFRQRGNGMTSYDLPGFDAAEMYHDGSKLRLLLRSNEVERFQEDSEPATPLGRFIHGIWKRFLEQLESEYQGVTPPP